MQQIVLLFVQVMALCILASGRDWAATGKEDPLAKVGHALAVVSMALEHLTGQGPWCEANLRAGGSYYAMHRHTLRGCHSVVHTG